VTRPPHPWKPGSATDLVRGIAGGDYALSLTDHAREQINDRNLIVGDVRHVLKKGFIYKEGEPSTRASYSKYKMECATPNSNNRNVRIVIIPSAKDRHIKVITVMWADEPLRGGGR
jgi:hypothetical protein